MRNYLLISGAWLTVAVAIAFAYSHVAAFGARSDAHLFPPRPGPRRRRASPPMPSWILAPIAMACAAAVLMADFALPPQTPPDIVAEAPQAVRMAEPPPSKERRRDPRRAAPATRPRSAGAPVSPVAAPVAAAPVAAQPQLASTMPRAGARPRRKQPRPEASGPSPSPTAVAASAPSPAATPPPQAAAGPPPQAAGPKPKKWTVHPPSKTAPGRVHRSKAPVGRPRCACR